MQHTRMVIVNSEYLKRYSFSTLIPSQNLFY